jgi:hypothetical protein
MFFLVAHASLDLIQAIYLTSDKTERHTSFFLREKHGEEKLS